MEEQNAKPYNKDEEPNFVTSEEKTWAMLVHLSAYLSFLLPTLGALIGTTVVWMLKRDDMPFVNIHGKEAVNFNITVFLAGIVSVALCVILIGYLMLFILVIYWFINVLIAAIKANDGKYHKYPFTIRFIK